MADGETDPFEGLGIAGGLMAGAGLLVWAPNFLDSVGASRTLWRIAAIVVGSIGFVGGLVEVSRLRVVRGGGSLADFGVAIFLTCIAAVLYWLQAAFSLGGPLLGAIKAAFLVVVFLTAVTFFFAAGRHLGKIVRDPARRERNATEVRERRARLVAELLGLLTALISLTAAIVAVVQASRNR